MAFNGNEGDVITLAEAITMTTTYRNSVPVGSTLGNFIGKNKLAMITNQTGCMGIRIYYGTDAQGIHNVVLVGADADENDMTEGVIIDKSIRCPPMCGNRKSPLNS